MAGPTRWQQVAGADEGEAYAARLAVRAETGAHMHGEADRVQALATPPARVLDAGCGTGRVGAELAQRGYEVVGVDVDPSMLATARRVAPRVRWIEADLAELAGHDLGATAFDVVVCAGNVVPLMAEGTEATAVEAMARRLAAAGVLVCGFGLDVAHLPLDDVPVTLADYDRWCVDAGLELVDRYATWEGAPFDGGGYHVSVHRRADTP